MSDIIDDGLCECCKLPPDDCICPVCPDCEAQGNPDCYRGNAAWGKHCITPKYDKGHRPPWVDPLAFNKQQLINQINHKMNALLETLNEDRAFIASIKGNQKDNEEEVLKMLNRILNRL